MDIRTTGNFDEPSPEDDINEKRRKSDLKQRTIKPQQSTIIEKKGINFDIGGFDVPKRVNKKFPSFS